MDCELVPNERGLCQCKRCGGVVPETDCERVHVMCRAGGRRQRRVMGCVHRKLEVPRRVQFGKCYVTMVSCELYGDVTPTREIPLVPCCRVCDDFQERGME